KAVKSIPRISASSRTGATDSLYRGAQQILQKYTPCPDSFALIPRHVQLLPSGKKPIRGRILLNAGAGRAYFPQTETAQVRWIERRASDETSYAQRRAGHGDPSSVNWVLLLA